VLGSVGSNHSSCRNVISPFVENGDFCALRPERESGRDCHLFMDLSPLHGTT